MLAGRARESAFALDHRGDAAERAGVAQDPRRRKPLRARGAYEISAAEGEARVSIFASGSEVSVAVAAQGLLEARGIAARVVSVPSFDAFYDQPEAYRRAVIGSARVRVGVEAGVREGWDALIGEGPFIGMRGFGASAPSSRALPAFRHHG